MTERVFIIGAGQVGRGLLRAFRASVNIDVLGLHGRRLAPPATSSGRYPSDIDDANVIVLAVRDEQIDGVVGELLDLRNDAGRRRIASNTVILHTSGGSDPESMQDLQSLGLAAGTFHPLIPFADPERAPDLLRSGWVGIDGDDQARAASRRLAGHVGARTIEIPPGRKRLYHAAAVMSSNFPVVLAAVASRLLADTGVPPQSAQSAVHSLMSAAVGNFADAPPEAVLTGPVVRGDTDTVVRHLAALKSDAEARALYRRLSLAAVEIASKRGTDPRRLAEIQSELSLR